MTNTASTPGPDDEAADEHADVAAALTDAGGEILRALTAPDPRSRRRHITKAQSLLALAHEAGLDEQTARRTSDDPQNPSGE